MTASSMETGQAEADADDNALEPVSAGGPAQGELHLVELHGEWTVTLTLEPGVIEAIANGEGNGTSAAVTVHIEPNLVPGQPFPASVQINRQGA